ncbi:MAG: DUF3179 domain-containing protein [Gemmatimonadaceae bacterium]|jgi:hypothetical protein|nr:DUF3179 domain-containing protein [Gemmatimonadaceae bacterium]
MRRLIFWAGIVLVICFEFAHVWFIMPLPGSQRLRSLDVAYALHGARWVVRLFALALVVYGAPAAWQLRGWRRWMPPIGVIVAAVVAYMTNVQMAADQIFRQPTRVVMQPVAGNTVAQDRLVVGVVVNGQARAYPLQYIGYHHQVRDTIGGEPVLVSYCTVCRTGRVFSPLVDGRPETFRLVGMDQFNAMFEDATTKSWWRQANGEAVTGPRRGVRLRELPSVQVTLAQWLAIHPDARIMQGDTTFAEEYAKDYAFERGTSRKTLTGTDTVSWGEKAWVVGITARGASVAFDWNRLKRERVINAMVGTTPVVLALRDDTASFFAFERPDTATRFAWRGDSLVSAQGAYGLDGRGATGVLTPINASQEFWHSWRTFQPGTGRY